MKKITVYIPTEKRKYNKRILARGFWKNEAGAIEMDYILTKEYQQRIDGLLYQDIFYRYLDNLKQIKTNGKPQTAIFYKINDIGYIYYSRDKIEVLSNRIYKEVLKENLKGTIKADLKVYGGLTFSTVNSRYFTEIFY